MSNEVQYSADVQRVLALPRREWDRPAAEALAVWLTNQLITEAGRAAGWKLLPQQAIALHEFYENWTEHRVGFFGALPVGSGKTLIFWLACYMIKALRPLFFCPANLRDVAVPRMFATYRQYWASPSPQPTIEGYSLLSQESELYVLENRQPDFLGFDECDLFRNYENTASKRVGGYIDVARGNCAVLALTGTPKRKSILDNSHIIKWCLRERAPVAISTTELQDHASALDSDADFPLRPGALLHYAAQTGVPEQFEGITSIGEQGRAREGYRRRMAQTKGILIWDESSCDQPLTITLLAPPEDQLLEDSFFQFRLTDQTPDGWPLNEAIEKWTHERQRGCGFYYYWDPRPPEWWLVPRYLAAVFCRDQIKATANYPRVKGGRNNPLDTERAVYRAHPNQPELLEWQAVKGKFEPNTVAGWISGSVVWAAAEWAKDKRGREAGIIWCIHEEMATAISQATGLQVFGAGGTCAATGMSFEEYHDSTPIESLQTIIFTFKANYRGRNAQKFHNALAVGWEPSAEYVEQGYLGRMHRQGQTRPCYLWVLCTSVVTLDAIYATMSEARGVLAEFGLTQKILTATIDRSGLAALPPSSRWVKASKER